MPCDYRTIRQENERRYGTDIGRIGPMLLANRYADRTHFIFELLQNAEDALTRRPNWNGERSVSFNLVNDSIGFSHFGKPFDEADVRGICGIAESTKDITDIGRFGIGFKSVYAFSDRPEVHSGDEDFAIENFVLPIAAPRRTIQSNETSIILPLRSTDLTGPEEIAEGLRTLGTASLLFLHQINEIRWNIQAGLSGLYLRETKPIEDWIRHVEIIGQVGTEVEIDETWLLFSNSIISEAGQLTGSIEIAFRLSKDRKSNIESIQRIDKSPLVVFFPTALETHLGFLVQGPYRTTPSRDNVPRFDPWNQHLVAETSQLLIKTLCWLRDQNTLDTSTLRCLPLDQTKFREDSIMSPLFDNTRQLLVDEPLLPRFDGGYVDANSARLADTQRMRELFSPTQLTNMYDSQLDLAWLSEDITHDRTPELRQYMMTQLGISELTPAMILPKLSKVFLEAQTEDWILTLYEFLNGQPSLRYRMSGLPLIRITDGRQVVPKVNGQAQAFLPSEMETGFPTIHPKVCSTDSSLEFLKSLGLTTPNLVDDIIRNVLPKYQSDGSDVTDTDYETDIKRILVAYNTDSKEQKDRLLSSLHKSAFVRAVDLGSGQVRLARACDLYLATDRLRELFTGIEGILVVDISNSCLRGDEVRDLLEASGAFRHIKPIEDESLPYEQRVEFRKKGNSDKTGRYSYEKVVDWNLKGLDELLSRLDRLETVEQRRQKARQLWEELAILEERRGKSVFSGEYTWTHYGDHRSPEFDSAFLRKLNSSEWVPDPEGNLQQPGIVIFETLGWKQNPFLQSRVRFKPPILDQLAEEAGLEPGLIDLLKKLGVTSEADLRHRLGIVESPPPNDNLPETDLTGRKEDGANKTGGGGQGIGNRSPGGEGDQGKARRRDGSRQFISYVGTHPDEAEDADGDGLDHERRMELEDKAIKHILEHEPQLRRTPTHNPGYDLYQEDSSGQIVRWIEVKAMTGCLYDRPVGLSHTQFRCAQEHSDDYWLYVVEHADLESPRTVRIQDPAGKARTFTFDHGWLSIAEIESDQNS